MAIRCNLSVGLLILNTLIHDILPMVLGIRFPAKTEFGFLIMDELGLGNRLRLRLEDRHFFHP